MESASITSGLSASRRLVTFELAVPSTLARESRAAYFFFFFFFKTLKRGGLRVQELESVVAARATGGKRVVAARAAVGKRVVVV